MTSCDMCGKSGELVLADVAGVDMTVCRSCASHGTIKRRPVPPQAHAGSKPVQKKEEIIHVIVDDYAQKVKQKREHLGLKQEELAQKVGERESVIHKIESGHHEPSMKVAQKLQRFLGINLITREEISHEPAKKASSAGLTIGDMIKFKK